MADFVKNVLIVNESLANRILLKNNESYEFDFNSIAKVPDCFTNYNAENIEDIAVVAYFRTLSNQDAEKLKQQLKEIDENFLRSYWDKYNPLMHSLRLDVDIDIKILEKYGKQIVENILKYGSS